MAELKRVRGLRKQDSLDLDAVLDEFDSEASEWNENEISERSGRGTKGGNRKTVRKTNENVGGISENGDLAVKCSEKTKVDRKENIKQRSKNNTGRKESPRNVTNLRHANMVEAPADFSQVPVKPRKNSRNKLHTYVEVEKGDSDSERGRRGQNEHKRKQVQINSQPIELDDDISEVTGISENFDNNFDVNTTNKAKDKLAKKKKTQRSDDMKMKTDVEDSIDGIQDIVEESDCEDSSEKHRERINQNNEPIPLCVWIFKFYFALSLPLLKMCGCVGATHWPMNHQ